VGGLQHEIPALASVDPTPKDRAGGRAVWLGKHIEAQSARWSAWDRLTLRSNSSKSALSAGFLAVTGGFAVSEVRFMCRASTSMKS
jgi:hypothetical protein